MKLPNSVCEVLRHHVVLESECIDRMHLNGYVPQLQRIGGCLVTPVKWSYQVRQYRPRPEIIDGKWKFPEAQSVQ